jgi:hypothetical protein
MRRRGGERGEGRGERGEGRRERGEERGERREERDMLVLVYAASRHIC